MSAGGPVRREKRIMVRISPRVDELLHEVALEFGLAETTMAVVAMRIGLVFLQGAVVQGGLAQMRDLLGNNPDK